MTNNPPRGKMLAKRDGFALCPRCGAKIAKVLPDTTAVNFPAWCRFCRHQWKIDIMRGQSYLSRSPDDPCEG